MSCTRGCCATEAEHYKSVAMQSAPTGKANDRDRLLSANLDAYYRLRQQGLHPPQIDKSCVLERRASDQFEINAGHLYKDEDEKKRVKEAVSDMQIREMTK